MQSGTAGIPEYAGQIVKPGEPKPEKPDVPEPIEPEAPTEPEQPIEEDPVTPVTPYPSRHESLPTTTSTTRQGTAQWEALRNLLSPTVRVYIYVIFGVIGIALGTWQTWLVSTDQLAPWFFGGVVAVYAYLGTFIAILAAPNTNKADA